MPEINLMRGWVKHPSIPGGYHLVYSDGDHKFSIITGPVGNGTMSAIAPGRETTYELVISKVGSQFSDEPMGYLTLEQIKGIIMYLRHVMLVSQHDAEL